MQDKPKVRSPEEEQRIEQEREFRESGTDYIKKAMVVEGQLDQFEDIQGVGEVIKRSIQNLGQEIANDPKLWEIMMVYRERSYSAGDERDASFRDKSLEAPSYEVAEKKLMDFIDASPVAKFLQSKTENAEQYKKILNDLLERIARYAQAIHRADEINSTKPYKSSFIRKDERDVEHDGNAGQVTYQFDKYLSLSTEAILANLEIKLPEGISFSDLDTIINATQVELIANLEGNKKLYSLLNWVVQTARLVRTENLKIFDTPETNELLTRLEEITKQHNGLGGAILFGPPGTGKTELLVERNRKMGFNSRVISIHHFSDYAQLIGERPIPISIDRTTSQIQRLKLVQTTLTEMSSDEKLSFVKAKFENGQEGWQTFLALSLSEDLQITSVEQINEENAKTIIAKLLLKLQSDIVNIGLGVQDGLDEETSWVRGEIIQAFDNGQMPILDEMDKGSEHSLEGISRLLNMTPGSSITLGNKEYTIPSWARVDGTANAMNLAPFLHDRFAPNVIYVDYPSAQDTLLKSLVWLSDEQGMLNLSAEKQQQFVGLVLYVFPEIQKLYPNVIEHPLSNRGIRKFCQMISGGEEVSAALEELLIKPGALTNSEKGRIAVQSILDRFASITSQTVTLNATGASSQKSDIANSIVYEAAINHFEPYDRTKGTSEEIEIKSEQKTALLEERALTAELSAKLVNTKVGTTVGIEEKAGLFSVVMRAEGKLLIRIKSPKENSFSNESAVAGVDSTGKVVLIRTNNTVTLIEVASGKTKNVISSKGNESYAISPDGKYLIYLNKGKISLHPIDEMLASKEEIEINSKELSINFVDEDGESIKCKYQDISDDGKFLQIETYNQETFIINLQSLNIGQKTIMLSHPFISESDWKLSRGNILVKADSDKAYLLRS